MEKLNLKFINEDENLSSYEEEIFFRIKKDSEVYSNLLNNGFSDETIKEHLGSCNQYYNDFHDWKLIKTYEDVINYGSNYYYNLKLIKGNIIREQEIFEQFKDVINYTLQFSVRDFDLKFRNITSKDVDNKVLLAKIRKELTANNWVYLYGAPRSGKSYCAIALANGYAKKNKDKIAFIDVHKRFEVLRQQFFNNKTQFDKNINILKEANILILDGIGNEYINDVVRDNIMLPILYERSNKKKTTIFTSNLSLNDLCTLYSSSKKDTSLVRAKQIKMILESMVKTEILTSLESLY